ncbi:MAG: class I SAM-dependent methyltransferase [Tenericutes bacterium]|jgi:SAM-dependent methyltransferase|nr:class I SAM-dependent methyltransferase [Mycoplasmatota bacterium]
MKEIEKNKIAWSLLAKDHYKHFKTLLTERNCLINENILNELGNIEGKSMIHLQCNTGADTISLARLGLSKIVGVDLSEENVFYANKLKDDFSLKNTSFIESDVLKLNTIHHDKYDIVFTSEGVLGWLPDLNKWAKVVKDLLTDDGYFYIYDSHPFLHVFDEESLAKGKLEPVYEYLNAKADLGYDIGGYACKTKHSENYWWNHSMSEIINALINQGLVIEYVNEFDTLFWNNGNMEEVKPGLFRYPDLKNKFPMSYSIKARNKINK